MPLVARIRLRSIFPAMPSAETFIKPRDIRFNLVVPICHGHIVEVVPAICPPEFEPRRTRSLISSNTLQSFTSLFRQPVMMFSSQQ